MSNPQHLQQRKCENEKKEKKKKNIPRPNSYGNEAVLVGFCQTHKVHDACNLKALKKTVTKTYIRSFGTVAHVIGIHGVETCHRVVFHCMYRFKVNGNSTLCQHVNICRLLSDDRESFRYSLNI